MIAMPSIQISAAYEPGTMALFPRSLLVLESLVAISPSSIGQCEELSNFSHTAEILGGSSFRCSPSLIEFTLVPDNYVPVAPMLFFDPRSDVSLN